MATPTKSKTVPKAMQEKFNSIAAITDEFAKQHLTDEYAQLIRFAIAALCRKRPSPLATGKDKTWACGITHAIGMVNFLFDSSQNPHIRAGELYQRFGVSASTGQAKSKLVREALGMHQLSPAWSLPSKLGDNSLVWMISINGLLLDVRSAPRAVQEIAYAEGLIPYIPGSSDDPREELEPSSAEQSTVNASPSANTSPESVYQLQVFLMGGPVTESFVAKNPEVSRIIEIKGRNTLADLHKILFQAFDREEEHLYEFQIGGARPNDPNARRYGLRSVAETALPGEAPIGDVTRTAIADLGLSKDDIFGYWFDFGDDWWHQINIISITEKATKSKYPKITQRVRDSPPHYADFE